MIPTKEEILQNMLNTLATKTGVNATEIGSISRSFAELVTDEIYGLYKEIDFLKKQVYPTTAEGIYLDEVAKGRGILREQDEEDNSLRQRIHEANFVFARGNRIAIEEALRTVSGVARVEIVPYHKGAGSLLCYLYPENGFGGLSLIREAESRLRQVVSEGIYAEVRLPNATKVNLTVQLVFGGEVKEERKQQIRKEARTHLQNWINGKEMGQTLYLNECIRLLLNQYEELLDLQFGSLEKDGISKKIGNLFPAHDEKWAAGNIVVL